MNSIRRGSYFYDEKEDALELMLSLKKIMSW